MTLTHTDRLALPLLAAGQAQKELAHNEALVLLDLLSQPVVQSADVATPPGSPAAGQCWIVDAAATGVWSGRDGTIAGWTDNGWRFAIPSAGWCAWVADRGHMMRFDGSNWTDDAVRTAGYYISGEKVVGARQAAIASPSGGTIVDGEARAALLSILTVLRAHGLIEN